MTAEAYLSQIGTLNNRITYHTQRLLRMRRDADAVTSPWAKQGGGAPAGDAPYVRALERIETMSEQLEQENCLLARLEEQAEETICSLPEEKHRLVLLYRYLEGKNYSQIGELMYVDERTVRRWTRSAMDRLPLPEEPISILA